MDQISSPKGFEAGNRIIGCCDENNWRTTESYWIAQFKEWGFNLVNQTLGGDGTHGRVLSEETKGKISLSLIGRRQSKAAVEKRALQLRGKKQKPESVEKSRLSRIGKKLTGEKLRRFQEKIKQRIPYNSKPVFQFTQDGMLIKGFESSAKAGEALNIDPSSILKCCKGQRKSAHNFIWKFS